MPRKNVELHQEANDAFNERDLDAFLEFFDPDIEFWPLILALEGTRPYRGIPELREFWKNMFSTFRDYSTELADIRDLGDLTLARALLRGHGEGSNAPIEQMSWQVVEWRAQKIIRFRAFRSEPEAVEAAGA